MVSDLTFKSSIHFDFIFVYGVKKVAWFDSFACSCLVFPTLFIEEALFSPLYILCHRLIVSDI